jgi:acetoin utilization deacetylase AcuC-like enzyme
VAAPVYLSHPASLDHDTGAHPERAARIVAIEAEVSRRGGLGFSRVEAPRVARDALLAVHPARYVTGIRELSEAGGGALDLDTVASLGSWEAAQRAAGGAVALVDALLSGSAPTGVSALRPPGHHAEVARAMGFCLFNNVAVAAQHALDAHGLSRVLVLDWDVHHGNGTEAIFAASPSVLYASIHEWPLYPGTGPASFVGTGDGRGFTVNLPVPAGSGDAVFVSLVSYVVAPLARAWQPQLVLVSAGYDAHRADPLATCTVTEAGYAAMTEAVTRFAADVGAPVGVVLEGGYALEALARSWAATMEMLGARYGAGAAAAAVAGAGAGPGPGSDAAAGADLPVHHLAVAAAERLAPWWPVLSAAG